MGSLEDQICANPDRETRIGVFHSFHYIRDVGVAGSNPVTPTI
jgi:hypothetical protein